MSKPDKSKRCNENLFKCF